MKAKNPAASLGSRQAARAAGRPGGRPAARPNTRGCPPLCLGSRQPARVAGLGGRTTRPSNSLSCLALRAILAAAPSVFEQLSVGFDRFCGHVPLLQNSTFRTPYPSVVNADFQFGGVVCQLNVAGLPAILEDAHMSHALGPPRGKAKIARSISSFSFGYCTSKYPAKRVSQGAPGEIAHMGILQNRV